MPRLFSKKVRPAGLPPGSLLYTGSEKGVKTRLEIVEYSEDSFIEKSEVTLEECLSHLVSPAMTWIQVYGAVNPKIVAAIGEAFKLHSLFVEDILTLGQRPKLDTFQDQVFIVARLLQYDEKNQRLCDEQVSLLFSHNYLITFVEGEEDLFRPIKERLRQGSNRMRKERIDYLAYSILDMIVDYYFIVLEKVDVGLDGLEEELMSVPEGSTLLDIQRAKRQMIILRKAIWPMRDVINRFIRLESSLINPSTRLYLQDVHDHAVQTIDIIESFRDVVSGMIDIYLSSINIRTNEIMKVLTIVSTIFVPLTFIASLYGMNFENMFGIHSSWGYASILAVMGITAAGMLIFFRRKKWI